MSRSCTSSLVLLVSVSLPIAHLAGADADGASPPPPTDTNATPPHGTGSTSASAPATVVTPFPNNQTIIVTADRQRETWDATTASTSVVSHDAMREQGFATNPVDYLRTVPGVDVLDANGGIDGGTEQIRLRGSATQADTAILLDNIPLLDVTATNGSAPLALLTMPGLDSIEVVRGSQSGLYGTHAVGGVVNFLTARPTATPTADVQAEYGSFDTWRIAGSATGPISGSALTPDGRPMLGLALGIDGIDSHGFATQTTSPDGKPQGFSDDGVGKIGGNARVEARPDDNTLLYVSGLYSNVYQAYSGYSAPDEDDFHRQQLWRIGGGAEHDFAKQVSLSADYAFTRSIRDEASLSNLDSQYTGNDSFLGVKLAAPVTDTVLMTVGADGDHQSAVTQSLDHESQSTEGVYGRAAYAQGPWNLDGVLRYDRTSRQGDATTYRLGAALSPYDRRLRLHAALGTAFTAPSLDEQFGIYEFPGGSFVGNPGLEAQTSLSFEAGIDIKPVPELLVSSTYFNTEYHRRIVAVYDPTFTNGTLVNEDSDSSIHGVENALDWDKPTNLFAVHATYTWQHTEDDSGNHFVLLPANKGLLDGIVRPTVETWALLGVDAIGKRLASDGSSLSGYATLHAAIGYHVTPQFTIYGRGENLLNKGYVTDQYSGTNPVTFDPQEFYYTGTPRSFFVGVEGRF